MGNSRISSHNTANTKKYINDLMSIKTFTNNRESKHGGTFLKLNSLR